MGGNLYLTYKKDTSRLLYWVINTSNEVIRSAANAQDCGIAINTTGQTTVSEIVNMSKLIAKHVQPIPSTIFNLFQAVIKARSAMYGAFQQMVKQVPDPEIERSNITHKHFIDALSEALHALGGDVKSPSKNEEAANDEDVIQLTLQNQFSVLSLAEERGNGDDGVSSEDDSQPIRASKKKTAVKGKKKGKRSRKSTQKTAPKSTEKAPLAEVPMESYRIIEDKDGGMSDYLLAVQSIIQEWVDLRAFVQDLWREVAYDGLNGAVAASLTNMAVSMVKQTCFAVFVDFPGHESYEAIMNTITRGDPDKAQGNYRFDRWRVSVCGHFSEKVQETALDVREQFFIHTYDNLVAFITDFQKNRTGKPTKAMQAQIKDWNPTLDLQRATRDERISWRRSYTINWLYDLVNVFSSIVVQRNTMKGEQHVYEDVDWSRNGPWHGHRRLYGLNEFAAAITTLAMQKPNTDIRQKILPHHVFQLQCIVDSLTVSRGWTLSALRGHVLNPPARKFHPRRDVDLFLDRTCKRTGQGFLEATDILKQVLEKGVELHGSDSYEHHAAILEDLKIDFVNWLGETSYKSGLTGIPPSRFSKYNANGLWEYSPLLCGAGLVEGLVLAQRVSMSMWDQMPEISLALHLHNMLVQKGYLQKPVDLFQTLSDMLEETFFPDGVPTSKFHEALWKQLRGQQSDRQSLATLRQRRAVARNQDKDIHQILDVGSNYRFKTKTALTMYYDADWEPERIPDSEVRPCSVLWVLRLNNTKRVTDPLTGQTRLEETELVKICKATWKMNDKDLLDIASMPIPEKGREDTNALLRLIKAPKEYKAGPQMDPYRVKEKKDNRQFQGRELLDILRFDIFSDVCGRVPLSAFNHVSITTTIMALFSHIEGRLRETRHPLYRHERVPQKRTGIIMAVMKSEDDDALKLMAEIFEKYRGGALIYWEDLREKEHGFKPRVDDDEPPTDACSVM